MLRRIWAVMQKEFIQTFRDRRTLLIQLGQPIILLFLIAYAINMNVDHVPMVVADQSFDAASQDYVNALVASGYFDIVTYVPNQAEVIRAIDEERARAGIVIPTDFDTHVERGDAQVVAAQAGVNGLKAGATREQIAALEARVAQAQAALESLLSQRTMQEVTSPMDGIVVDMIAHLGEVVSPGAALLTVADLSVMHLTVYLPETHIGRVRLGQSVRVAVDSFPGQVFEGQVIHIADRAEFTPRNVATKEERVNLVFAVKVRLPNDDGAFKPGMPADVEFGN